MRRIFVLLFCCCVVILETTEARRPFYPQSRFSAQSKVETRCGNQGLWPLPQECQMGNNTLAVASPERFRFKGGEQHQVVELAIDRIKPFVFQKVIHTYREKGAEPPMDSNSESVIMELEIRINSTNAAVRKVLGDDESFEITIEESGKATLWSESDWGALYGLEMFSQLVRYDEEADAWRIDRLPLHIKSQPNFSWRGLLIDSANHFLPKSVILRTISAMSASSFNVLHWHMVDSYSFPFQSRSLPLLSEMGSWSPDEVYTHEDIKDIVEHARVHGIRVVPELDMPGHAYSWGLSYPNLTVECPQFARSDLGHVNSVPLDPSKEETYEAVFSLLKEFAELFPDMSLHVGGDEVIFGCWNESVALKEWMQARSIDNFIDLEAYFADKVWPVARNEGKSLVVWQEAFRDLMGSLAPNDIVEVWSNKSHATEVLEAGFQVLIASQYYLDRQTPVDGSSGWFWEDTWRQMYMDDPLTVLPKSSDKRHLLLGGEANMWGEQVDHVNFDSRVWPRAAAVAERLWTSFTDDQPADSVEASIRLAAHRCRLVARGVGAGPIWSDNCRIKK